MTEMVLEMIRFLQKWGLWQETMILADGNAYKSSRDKRKCFQGIPYVKVEEKVDPDEYLGELSEPSPHIFDMTFDSALTEIFVYHEMELSGNEISREAWEYIFAHSQILDELIRDHSGPASRRELQEKLIDVGDREYTLWDPLEDDLSTRDGESEEAMPVYTLFDSDEDYRRFLNGEDVDLRRYPELWDLAVRYGIRYFSEWKDTILIRGGVIGHIMKELNAIFKKYGLWYEPEESWMIIGRRSIADGQRIQKFSYPRHVYTSL